MARVSLTLNDCRKDSKTGFGDRSGVETNYSSNGIDKNYAIYRMKKTGVHSVGESSALPKYMNGMSVYLETMEKVDVLFWAGERDMSVSQFMRVAILREIARLERNAKVQRLRRAETG